MTKRPKHAVTSDVSSHHREPISCKITESWKLQPVVSSPLENVITPLHRKLFLLSCSYHSQMHWVNIQGSTQRISYPAHDLPRTKFNPDPFGKCRNRNPRSLNHPAQIISAHQHLNNKHVLVVLQVRNQEGATGPLFHRNVFSKTWLFFTYRLQSFCHFPWKCQLVEALAPRPV